MPHQKRCDIGVSPRRDNQVWELVKLNFLMNKNTYVKLEINKLEISTSLSGSFVAGHWQQAQCTPQRGPACLPHRELLVMVMRKHQRYFPVYSESGDLLPVFITVPNGVADPRFVRVGASACPGSLAHQIERDRVCICRDALPASGD